MLLRRWTLDDLPCIEQAAGDAQIMAGTTVPATWSPAEGRAFIARQHGRLAQREGVSLAIVSRADGQACGLVFAGGVASRGGAVEVGYWVVAHARRRGLGGAAVGLLVRWLAGLPGVDRIEARVEPANAASIALLRSLGFAPGELLPGALSVGEEQRDLRRFTCSARGAGWPGP